MRWKKTRFETKRGQRDEIDEIDEIVHITESLSMRRARFVGIAPGDDPGCTLVITTNGRFTVSEPFDQVEARVYARELDEPGELDRA